MLLLDASDSVLRPRPSWSREVRATLREVAGQALERGARIEVVAYGRNQAWLFPLGDPERLLAGLAAAEGDLAAGRPADLDTRASDLVGALERLEERGRFGSSDGIRPPIDRVVWFSDGQVDRPDQARARWERLIENGVAVERRSPGPPERGDLDLLGALVPTRSAETAPIPVVVTLGVTGPAPAIGEGAWSDAWIEVRPTLGGSALKPRRFALAPLTEGVREVRFNLPSLLDFATESGRPASSALKLELRVASDHGGDAFEENDRAWATVLPGEALEVLLVGPDPAAARRIASSIGLTDAPGFVFRTCESRELAAQLNRAAVVVLADLPPSDPALAPIEGFLRAGGGVLWCGGAAQLVPRDGAGVLPLLPFVAEPTDREPRHVRLLMDRSGSMVGEPFTAVREAAIELARAMAPADRLTLQFFTDALLAEIPLLGGEAGEEPQAGRSDERVDRVRKLVNLPRASGATALLYSLEQLAKRLEAGGEKRELVLLLTDGREESDPVLVAERTARLADSFANSSTELCAIAIGERAEVAYLSQLVGPRGEVLLAPSPESLSELVEERSLADRFLVVEEAAIGRTEPFGLGFQDDWPGPGRAVRGRVRDRAQVLLESDAGDPLASAWRVGAGLCVALASLPGEQFGPGWSGRGDLFGPLLRGLDAGELEGGQLRVVPSSDPGGFAVAGLRPAGPARRTARFVGSGELEFELVPDPATDQPGLFRPAGPRSSLEALAWGEAGEAGSLLIEEEGRLARLPFAVPVLPEHRPRAGGLELPRPGAISPQIRGAHPSHRPLLALGLLLGGLGLVLGRWGVHPRKPAHHGRQD